MKLLSLMPTVGERECADERIHPYHYNNQVYNRTNSLNDSDSGYPLPLEQSSFQSFNSLNASDLGFLRGIGKLPFLKGIHLNGCVQT
jgi:hypothetical protein